jgi:predicted Rossmann fold nucleotide-binding protein DprA/Smf involved in DNA uptake
VTKGERLAADVALCALYLRGAPFARCVRRRRWPLVVDALRRHAPSLAALDGALRESGHYDEAAVLADPRTVAWAHEVCASRRAVTVLDPWYPSGWTESLGAAAPPCAWVRGTLPAAPTVGVVGSRVLDAVDRSFAGGVARALMAGGYALASGGAVGADSVALDAALGAGGAGRCVEVLPCGLDASPAGTDVCQLSVCEPWAPFTTAQAMERNALIHAYGRRCVVVRARLREGGTWHGAVDALRRRLAVVYVRSRASDPASAALVALGAVGVGRALELASLLATPPLAAQPALFGAPTVRCPEPAYA